MAEDDLTAKPGRPSHADLIAGLTNAVETMTVRLDMLEDEVARKQSQPTVFTNPDLGGDSTPDEYCACGSNLASGRHFEGPNGPCPNEPAVAETVAA